MSPAYRSSINTETRPASEQEFRPLELGPLRVWPPVVLAPMAGVTNYPFRQICREFGAGLYVSEMITARGLVGGNRKTAQLAQFGPDEKPRSIQFYGTDPRYLAEATRLLVGEGRVDHIDLNFGCPVRKVMAQGGGAAIPYKPRVLASLVRSVVHAAGDVPVTIKVRKGIDEAHLTYRTSGEVARDEGCKAIGLHARTAAQLYDGLSDWHAIADLKSHVPEIPVLGNGDIWEPWDALRMLRQTRCDGVIVGRGCLGRPWLFRDLVDVFEGREPQALPGLGTVITIMRDHARRLVAFFEEYIGIRHMRKWCAWYTKGFQGTAPVRRRLAQITSLSEFDAILDEMDPATPIILEAIRSTRAKHSGRQTPALPAGYLDDPADDSLPGLECETVDGG
ncbi:MAG: tRNA dihydrouridine synthase DusB [Planctomycetota bacterium]